MNINLLLFDRFETLDAFGPVEMLSDFGKNPIGCYSLSGGEVLSSHRIPVRTEPLSAAGKGDILLLPGGMATRTLVGDEDFLSRLRSAAEEASFVLTVCTGSALLAATGLLDGRRATSNKRAFDWVRGVNPKVQWVETARWVADGKFYTASGVSAGMDMALGFMRDRQGDAVCRRIAEGAEYLWIEDSGREPFSREGKRAGEQENSHEN